MISKTTEIRLMISCQELVELKESLDQTVKDLSDELEECIEANSKGTVGVADKLRAAQSTRCKIKLQVAMSEEAKTHQVHRLV